MHERHWQENNKHHLIFPPKPEEHIINTWVSFEGNGKCTHISWGQKQPVNSNTKEASKTRSFALSPLFELRAFLIQHPSEARVLQFPGFPASMAQHYWRLSLGTAAEKHRTIQGISLGKPMFYAGETEAQQDNDKTIASAALHVTGKINLATGLPFSVAAQRIS